MCSQRKEVITSMLLGSGAYPVYSEGERGVGTEVASGCAPKRGSQTCKSSLLPTNM